MVAKLPGFEPGPVNKLYYNYTVAFEGNNNQTFLATAAPLAGAPAGNLAVNHTNTRVGW